MEQLTKDFINMAVKYYFKGMSCKDALEKARAEMGAYDESLGGYDTEGTHGENCEGYKEKAGA